MVINVLYNGQSKHIQIVLLSLNAGPRLHNEKCPPKTVDSDSMIQSIIAHLKIKGVLFVFFKSTFLASSWLYL